MLLTEDRAKRVYIAGPMTGLPEFNFPAFNAMAATMRAEGWHVENPAEHGHVEGAEWEDYLRYDIARLATCECIMLLPGWSKSRGARLEVHIARQLGMAISMAPGAEEAPAQGDWIKFSDRKPGKELDGMAVIVAVKHRSLGLISECAAWNHHNGRLDFWDSQATHWQPLPPPPGAQP